MTITIENKNGNFVIENNKNEVYCPSYKTWNRKINFFSTSDYENVSFHTEFAAREFVENNNLGTLLTDTKKNQAAIFWMLWTYPCYSQS